MTGQPLRQAGSDAMVAGGRDGLLVRRLRRAAVDQADIAPDLILIQAIERMAGAHAGLAARAKIEIHGEGILLAALRRVSGMSAW